MWGEGGWGWVGWLGDGRWAAQGRGADPRSHPTSTHPFLLFSSSSFIITVNSRKIKKTSSNQNSNHDNISMKEHEMKNKKEWVEVWVWPIPSYCAVHNHL